MCTWSCTHYWHPKYHFHILKSKCDQLCKVSRGKIGVKYLQLWLGFPSSIFFSSGVKSLIFQDSPMEKFGKEHGNLNVVTVMMEYFYIMNLATMESYKKKKTIKVIKWWPIGDRGDISRKKGFPVWIIILVLNQWQYWLFTNVMLFKMISRLLPLF